MTPARRLVPALLLTAVGTLPACATPAAPGSAGITVHGAVLAAPGCPVQRASSPCPALPVPHATVVASRSGHDVAAAVCGSRGSFTFTLPPGTYLLTARTTSGYQSSASTVLHIGGAAVAPVTLILDSGIR